MEVYELNSMGCSGSHWVFRFLHIRVLWVLNDTLGLNSMGHFILLSLRKEQISSLLSFHLLLQEITCASLNFVALNLIFVCATKIVCMEYEKIKFTWFDLLMIQGLNIFLLKGLFVLFYSFIEATDSFIEATENFYISVCKDQIFNF